MESLPGSPWLLALLAAVIIVEAFWRRWRQHHAEADYRRHHRVHHASNPAYLDRNFDGVLIIYDRMFGTFMELNADDPIRYGLTRPVTSRNIFAIALGEWRGMYADLIRARTWRERFAAAFGRPALTMACMIEASDRRTRPDS